MECSIKQHLIFPTPIWTLSTTEHPSTALSWALSHQNNSSVIKSNRGGYQSQDQEVNSSFPYLDHLKKRLEFLPSFYFMNWWVNINHIHSYNIAHNHPGADLSVVWYLTHNHSGIIRFLNSNEYARHSLHSKVNIDNDYGLKCDVGDIIVFPADLMHYVESNTSTTPRVSVALNLKLQ